MNIPQSEADNLLLMDKRRLDSSVWNFPGPGESLNVPLISSDGREEFALDLYRGQIVLSKCTYQNRARHAIVLARVDIGGGLHRNPDGEIISCPHLHVYREGYADKWAQSLPESVFIDPSNVWQTLDDFMTFCHVTEPPFFQRGLLI
ncbi:MAG: hypothetical protein PHI18_02535 [bacterium]|nr:hypothetical protein [bacterium]